MLGEVVLDGAHELSDAGEAALAHCVLSEVAEEALDQVHPGARGRREMKDEARAAVVTATLPGIVPSDPAFHLRMLMGGIVVDNQMQREIGGRLLVEVFEKRQPLPVGVVRCRLREDLAVEIGKGGEECNRAVAGVIVGLGAEVTDAERQTGLGAFERLALLFSSQHRTRARSGGSR